MACAAACTFDPSISRPFTEAPQVDDAAGLDAGDPDAGPGNVAPGAAGVDAAEPPPFGAACNETCGGGLTCFMTVGMGDNGTMFPDGFCSQLCTAPADCSAQDRCAVLSDVSLCIPVCDLSMGIGCRDDAYACCSGGKQAMGPGLCLPAMSSQCGGGS
jgi:hypothetical protein